MTLLEFAESVSPIPLLDWQKKYISNIDKVGIDNCRFVYIGGRRNGKRMIADFIMKYKEVVESLK